MASPMVSCFAEHIIREKGMYYKTKVMTEERDSRGEDNGLPCTPQARATLIDR